MQTSNIIVWRPKKSYRSVTVLALVLAVAAMALGVVTTVRLKANLDRAIVIAEEYRDLYDESQSELQKVTQAYEDLKKTLREEEIRTTPPLTTPPPSKP